MIVNIVILPIYLLSSFNGNIPSYIDPGTGLSAIGAALAVGASIIVTIFGFFWYPIKRLLGKNKKNQEPEPIAEEED